MPFLLNSMNVLAVINRLSAFGRFSYPAKLYEAMACSIPVVATATEPATWILGGEQRFLVRPGDSHDLALENIRPAVAGSNRLPPSVRLDRLGPPIRTRAAPMTYLRKGTP